MTFMEHNTNAVLLSASCRSPVTGMGPLGAVLYCIDGVVIAAKCTATFQHLLCSPNLGTRTWIWRLNFAQRPIFSGLRFFNKPEISHSGPPAYSPSQRTCGQDFYVLKKIHRSHPGLKPRTLDLKMSKNIKYNHEFHYLKIIDRISPTSRFQIYFVNIHFILVLIFMHRIS